jgi:hypothetical protein
MKTESMSKMNEHEKAAYVTLLDTAEKLWSLVANARSSDHPLALPDPVITAIRYAVLELHKAQREME